MSVPRVTIVGAGAMGVVTGYHLASGGAEVTYLVRPGRATRVPSEYRLYSYDDGRTHDFGGYAVFEDPSAVQLHTPDFVLVALDGASITDDTGKTLLAAMGDAIRDTATILVIGSIGIGLREMAVATSGLPDDRVISGMIALLAHATAGVALPARAPTDSVALARSHFAFRHLNESAFVVEDRNATAAERFADIFTRSGLGECRVVSPDVFGVQSRAIMPVFAACEILGWPDADSLFVDPLWRLTVEAVRSIQALPEHGNAGKIAAAALTPKSLAELWRYLEGAAHPLDWQAFNAHQHGAKVKRADFLLLAACIERGRAAGRDMSALAELVALGGRSDAPQARP